MRTLVGRRLAAIETSNEPALDRLASIVCKAAKEDLQGPLNWDPALYNPLLIRARRQQKRLFNALVAWKLTGDRRFRDNAFSSLLDLDKWPQWCSAAFAPDNRDPNGFFDLSYGENSFTLAVGFDALSKDLSKEECRQLVDIAERRSLTPFLIRTEPGSRSFWFGSRMSNWNAVCSGGAGMLALVMEPYFKKTGLILRRVEMSLKPLLKHLSQHDGGWEEGIGYWNYCMRYLFHYLLAWEAAGKGPHPATKMPALKKTLQFPLLFSPWTLPAGFGDANSWQPMPIHLAMAERLKDPETADELRRLFQEAPLEHDWPHQAEVLIFAKTLKAPKLPAKSRALVAKRFQGLDWMVLADRHPRPNAYVSIRGGKQPLAHGHLDLLSGNIVLGGEAILTNIPLSEYQGNTFSPRRWEIPDLASPYKNCLLINGVGCKISSQVSTSELQGKSGYGYAMDATGAFDYRKPAHFVGRALVDECGRGHSGGRSNKTPRTRPCGNAMEFPRPDQGGLEYCGNHREKTARLGGLWFHGSRLPTCP